MKVDSIFKSIEAVTKKWTKQRKAEERGSERSRRAALAREPRVEIKRAYWRVMKDAYLRASGGGKYPAAARQIYYAARPAVLKATGRTSLDSAYFTQHVLPRYMEWHRNETADWDVVYDARGHFAEPHTDLITPLGTIDVRQYLSEIETHEVRTVSHRDFRLDTRSVWPTRGPDHRFGAILFIEKEGFLPLFEATKLAERYDIGIMSTKGMTVVAARRLADELCGRHRIPLLVLHDFDKAGFSILGSLTGAPKYDRDGNQRTARYEYRHDLTVIDLGLRLEDVKKYELQAEPVPYKKSDPRDNLRENGATEEEIGFLCQSRDHYGWHGRRVELNAFTSDVFIAWIEEKLTAHGIKKVVPGAATLADACRRAYQVAVVHEALADITDNAATEAAEAALPGNLPSVVRKRLKAEPALPWDAVVARLAAANLVSNGERATAG